MSLQPNRLCKLRRGKALAAFPEFVDTFNWLVDFCTNLIGESESTAQSSGTKGSNLRVDRSVSDHPVIRGGAEGGGSVTVVGTDGTKVEGVSSIEFKSGDDSNFNVSVSEGGTKGSAIVKIDVYYR